LFSWSYYYYVIKRELHKKGNSTVAGAELAQWFGAE